MVVLMTGTSGALGGTILRRLCGEPSVERVYALAHETPVVVADEKIRVIRGAVTSGPSLGLSDHDARQVAADATAVLHAAARTTFNAPLSRLRATNVVGTANVTAFANSLSRVDRVCVLSTVYVAGRRTGLVRESDLSGASGFVNAYEQSKFEMEEWLLAHAAALPVAVARLSTAVGQSTDGSVDTLAAVHHALRFYYQSLAPMLPGEPASRVDLIATDYAAAAIVALLCHGFQPGACWHVCAAEDAPCLDELLDLALAAFLASRPAWRRRAIEKPVIVPLATFERFADSVEELQDVVLTRAVAMVRPFAPQLAFPKQFDDSSAQATLQRCGVARPLFREYFPRVIEHLITTHWSHRDHVAAVQPFGVPEALVKAR